MQGISEEEESLFNFKRFSCAQNVPLAFVITMKYSAMNSLLSVFVFSVLLGGSCSQKPHLETIFCCFTLLLVPLEYMLSNL